MPRLEVSLPEVGTWSTATLVEAGIPKDARYARVEFRKGRMLLASAEGHTDTLIGRLMCIKNRSGSTDSGIHIKLSKWLTTTLVAELQE